MEHKEESVFVVQTPITRRQLQMLVELLNMNDLANFMQDEDDPQPLLTIEEVLGNPELLAYLCNAMVGQNDLWEIWTSDGFCEFATFRK